MGTRSVLAALVPQIGRPRRRPSPVACAVGALVTLVIGSTNAAWAGASVPAHRTSTTSSAGWGSTPPSVGKHAPSSWGPTSWGQASPPSPRPGAPDPGGSDPSGGAADLSWWVTTHFCADAFGGRPRGSLQKTTSAGPTGSTVVPGQKITVTLTWKPSDFVWTAPSTIADCVEIGSHLSPMLTQVHGPGPTDGSYTFTYEIPPGGTAGQAVCDRGVAWGRNLNGFGWGDGRGPGGKLDDTEKSAVLCYTILGAVAPEAPAVVLFPLVGLAVGGGAVWYSRRRRSRAQFGR